MLALRIISTVILGICILIFGAVTLTEKSNQQRVVGTLFLLGLIFVLTTIWVL